MSFKDKFTTEEIKKNSDNPDIENKKTVVSNDAYLNAEMTESLIKQIENTTMILRRR